MSLQPPDPSESADAAQADFIAVVGHAARFPGARDSDAFWALLKAGGEPLHEFTDEELRAEGFPEALLKSPNAVKRGLRLEDAEAFDAAFFGYTPGQARSIDPQQRLLLELCWQALEHAGCCPGQYGGVVGLFAGSSPSTYPREPNAAADPASYQSAIDSGQDFPTTRVSYKLDLTGPSIAVQTACSSSLVAVHLACQSLLNFECDAALAGGVSIRFPQAGYLYHKGHILSPDGHCRAYDADAGGTIPGRGGAIVVLKRLEDALRDHDRICAVIRGSAVNNDGHRKVGFTAPAIEGQKQVVAAALAIAGVEPSSITMLEGHGTGTSLGDAIELSVLSEIFASAAPGACSLGSVKSNLGHLDAAAGVTGLLKAILCLENRALAPTLHYRRPNAALAGAQSPFVVPVAHAPWPAGASPRRAGVSAFGIGGTNAHVVLEETPPQPSRSPAAGDHLIVLSARNATALAAARDNLRSFLERQDDVNLADVAFTLQVGRKAFEHRLSLVARDRDDLIAKLQAAGPDGPSAEASDRRPIFRFDGGARLLGADFEAMRVGTFGLLVTAQGLLDQLDPALASEIAPFLKGRPAANALEPQIVERQAGLILECAAAHLWIRLGVTPHRLVFAGDGMLAAACVGGLLSTPAAVDAVGAAVRAADGGELGFASGAARAWQAMAPAEPPTYPIYEERHAASVAATSAASGFAAYEPRSDDAVIWLASRPPGPPAHEGPVIIPAPSAVGDPHELLQALGALWSRGAPVDWSRFNAGGEAFVTSLPAYPFQRELLKLEAGTPPAPTPGEEERQVSVLFPTWTTAPRPAGAPRPAADEDGCWLLLCQGADAWAARLRAQGRRAVALRLGDRFLQLSEDAFQLDRHRLEGLSRLLAKLDDDGVGRLRLVLSDVAGGLTEPAAATGTGTEEPRFIALLQQLIAGSAEREVHLTLLCRGLYGVTDDEPLKAPVALAPMALLAASQENPNFDFTLFDFAGGDDDTALTPDQVDRVIRDTTDPACGRFVAYRGRARFSPTFQSLGPDLEDPPRMPLEPGEVHLIIGGFGKLGMALAARLAGKYGAKVVIAGRRLPTDSEDLKWTSPAPAQTAIERLRSARFQAGWDIHGAALDVTDGPAFRQFIAEVESRLGAIEGVYYLAGETHHPSIDRKISEGRVGDLAAQVSSKGGGFEIVAGALADRPARIQVAYSSAAAILGGPGRGFYGAANRHLDQLVAQANREAPAGSGWTVINWDAWSDRETEPDSLISRYTLAPDEGLDVLEWIVGAGHRGQVGVIVGNLAGRLSRWTERRPRRAGPEALRTDLPAPAGFTELEAAVAAIWRQAIGVEAIGLDDQFFDLGGDSLMAVQILEELEGLLGIDLDLAAFLVDRTTVRTVCAYLASELAKALGQEDEAALLGSDLSAS